ncbi:MAG: repair protein [Segetibacter sp.]|nr:repair protein [Segetibacter sp.]
MPNLTNTIASIVAEIEISYRPKIKASARPQISVPQDAYKLFLETWDVKKIEFVEQFKVMLLNRSKRVLGICTLTTGGVGATIVDPKLVFGVALTANASEIIVAHNHPSGSLQPSKADYELTYKLKTAGDYLDLTVTDHLIITPEGYYSFAYDGVL